MPNGYWICDQYEHYKDSIVFKHMEIGWFDHLQMAANVKRLEVMWPTLPHRGMKSGTDSTTEIHG